MPKHTPTDREPSTQLTDQERALDRLMRRGVPVEQLAGELGVTRARADELIESLKAKAMTARQRRGGRPEAEHARHRRLARRRREAGE